MTQLLDQLRQAFEKAVGENPAAALLAVILLVVVVGGGYIIMERDRYHQEIEMKRVKALDTFLQGVLEKIKEPAPPPSSPWDEHPAPSMPRDQTVP